MMTQTEADRREAQAFADDLLRLMRTAESFRLPFAADLLNTIHTHVIDQLGLTEFPEADDPVPFVPAAVDA
jgi:hypothetical protein